MADQMKDSRMTDTWIYEACRLNPVSFVIDPETGLALQSVSLGPVRLSFTDNLLEKGKKMKTDPNSGEGFSVTPLFTPWTDLTLLRQEEARIVRETPEFKDAMPNPAGGFYGLRDPIRDQGEKAAKFKGYTPGLKFTNCSANIKPPVVDTRMNPIIDKAKVYPGVWGILVVNAYASKTNKANMGVRFGIQSVMIFADDDVLGGGTPADAKKMFAGAKVQTPSAPAPAAMGAPPVGQAAVGAYYPAAAPAPAPAPAPAAVDPLAQFM